MEQFDYVKAEYQRPSPGSEVPLNALASSNTSCRVIHGQRGPRKRPSDTTSQLQETTIDPRKIHINPLNVSGASGRNFQVCHPFWESFGLENYRPETNTLTNVVPEHSLFLDGLTIPNLISSQTPCHSKAALYNGDSSPLLHPPYPQPVPTRSHREQHMGEDRTDAAIKEQVLAGTRGKRIHDLIDPVGVGDDTHEMPSPKLARLEYDAMKGVSYGVGGTVTQSLDMPRIATRTSYYSAPASQAPHRLSDKQKAFIHQWRQTFSSHLQDSSPPNESINALATLLQSSPQPIREYFNADYETRQRLKSTGDQSAASPLSSNELPSPRRTEYVLKEANPRLDPQTLALVEKYVTSCRRRRAQNDGRRSVNEGPLKCTYGCGYRTKRAFDWKRHEETHEPQELWLCHLCGQNDEPNPFLVNRKDKFLKHVKDAHKKWEPETVLDMSKVDFQADFNPRCHLCPEVSTSWDDRCRHVLSHYEDSIQRDARKGRVSSKGVVRKKRPPERDADAATQGPPSSGYGSDQSSARPGSGPGSEKDPG